MEPVQNVIHFAEDPFASFLKQEAILRKNLRKLPADDEPIGFVQASVIVACPYVSLESFIMSSRGPRAIADTRMVAMCMCYRLGLGGYKAIGDRFGWRDHSTVLRACESVARSIDILGDQYLRCLNTVLLRLHQRLAKPDIIAMKF